MEIKLSEFSSGKTIHHQVYPDNFNSSSDLEEEHSRYCDSNYTISLTENWFEGIHICQLSIQSANDCNFYLECDKTHIGLFFCLSGSIQHYNNELKDHVFSVSQHQFHISGNTRKCITFNTASVQGIFIRLTPGYYLKIVNDAFDATLGNLKERGMSAEIKNILDELSTIKYAGRPKRLLIEAKILEMLVHLVTQQPRHNNLTMKDEDISKIMLAKTIVENNIQKPYSILELSRKAGLNDYKLKKGFKEIVGHTVFGYLNHIRMEKAHQLLTADKKAVNEVSFLVGYKNAQHFIAAFKKKYNILPGKLKKI